MGFAGAGWAEEDHVLLSGDKVQRAQMGDLVALQTAGVVEVKLLQALAGREPGCTDVALAAMRVPGGNFTLQACGQILLMRPGFGPGPLGQPGLRLAQGGRLHARVRNTSSLA